MQKAFKASFVGLAGFLVMLPLPEIVVSFGQKSSYRWPTLLALAFTVSMVQLTCEYLVIGQASRSGPWLKQWWADSSRIRPFWEDIRPVILGDTAALVNRFRPWFQAGGYTTMMASCLNPITVMPPFGRITAVTIWRTAHLPGSIALIIGLSLLKLVLILAGVSLFVR